MPDHLTPEERAAIAAFRGKVKVLEPGAVSDWGIFHDGKPCMDGKNIHERRRIMKDIFWGHDRKRRAMNRAKT